MKQIFLTLAILAAPFSAHAGVEKYSIEDAKVARISGREDIALQILSDIERNRPLDPYVKFEKAVALAQSGKCAAASRTFNRGRDLTDHPSFNRAAEDAMTHLCPKLSPFETNFYGELITQSNANGGSHTDTITVNGLDFSLSDDALAHKGTHLRFGGRMAYNIALTHQHYVVPNADIDFVIRENAPTTTITPEFGLSYRFRGDLHDFRIGPAVSYTYEAGDLAYTTASIKGFGSLTLSEKSALLYSFSTSVKDFKGTIAEEETLSASLSYVRRLDNGRNNIRLSLSHQTTDATNYMNELDQTSISASLTGTLRDRYGYDIFASHTWVSGEIVDPFFGVRRSDKIISVGANLSLPFADSVIGRPYVGINHSRSTSSFETKNYTNTGFSVGFTRSF